MMAGNLRNIDHVIARLPQPQPVLSQLEAPPYKLPTKQCPEVDCCNGYRMLSENENGGCRCETCNNTGKVVADNPCRVGLAVESMKHHTTDEGWQVFAGLESAGWKLFGYRIPPRSETEVPNILRRWSPGTVLVQDKREWDLNGPRDFREPHAKFQGVESLAYREDVFKLTILKDSHQRPDYHRQSAAEMGVHAWVVYYHPRIVHHLAPWTRPQHLIRTWHTVDTDQLLPFSPGERRRDCLLSGAMGAKVYPMRTWLHAKMKELTAVTYLRHPGYHRNGCCTPEFLRLLDGYKVAICTSSIYGYALRKIIEATACGCRVITDLPTDEVLPEIDGNLIRVNPNEQNGWKFNQLVKRLATEWDANTQRMLADKAKGFYDYRVMGQRLASDIEAMRRGYNERTGSDC